MMKQLEIYQIRQPAPLRNIAGSSLIYKDLVILALSLICCALPATAETRQLSRDELRDKIRGGYVYGLKPGKHTVRLVATGNADPRSKGKKVSLSKAVVYRAAD